VTGVIATLAVIGMSGDRPEPASIAGELQAAPLAAPPLRPADAPASTSAAPAVALARETAPASIAAPRQAAPVTVAAVDRPAEPVVSAVVSPAASSPAVATPAPVAVEPAEPAAIVEAEPETPPPPAREAEAPLVSPAETEQIQIAQMLLAAQGYEPGPADGEPGSRTLGAAAEFASRHRLEDANIDAAFLSALRAAATGTLQAASAEDDAVVVRVARVREIQSLLGSLGRQVGRPDGDAGPQTLRAADAFAAEHDLVDSHLDAAFLALLREEVALR
jgi:peptidoglycan hydrolase-like protein with peptidoglycan-binding domain